MADDNLVDLNQRARIAADKLRQAAREEAIELGPQLVGALQGLAEEIRSQRLVTERLINELDEQRCVARQTINALAALTTALDAVGRSARRG